MNSLIRIAAALGAALLASACSHTTPHWDRHFGSSVRILAAQQARNPDAVRNADPVAGIDGQAARAAHERYEKSFAVPRAQADAFTIGVGGAK